MDFKSLLNQVMASGNDLASQAGSKLGDGQGGMSDMTKRDFRQMIEESVVDTFITEYRVKPENEPLQQENAAQGELVAAALCDRLSDGISMVYSFFSPEESDRSLGSYMVLDHVERTLEENMSYVYLGYWVANSSKMEYKARFKPLEALGSAGWAPLDLP